MGIKSKTADNQDIKTNTLNGFFSSFFDLLRPDGAVLRTNTDRNPLCLAVFIDIFTGRLNNFPGIGI
jgi:hypothetical protein